MMVHIIAEHLRKQGMVQWSILQAEYSNALVLWMFRPGEPEPAFVAKISRSDAGADLLRREAAALATIGPVAKQIHAPEAVLYEDTDAGVMLLQSGLPGCPLPDELPPHDAAQFRAQLELIEPWLEDFHSVVAPASRLITQFQKAITSCYRIPDVSGNEQKLLSFATGIIPDIKDIAAAPVHGDFWSGNVLTGPRGLFVVDWADLHFGAPTEDLYNFTAGMIYRDLPDPTDSANILWSAFFGESPLVSAAGEVALRTLRRWNLGPDHLRTTFVQFLITRLALVGFKNYPAWRAFANRYVDSGMPVPFSLIADSSRVI